MKKLLFSLFILLLFPFILTSCSNEEEYDIVTTNFAAYDIAKNVAGDKLSSGMLLKPGVELHDYSPSIADIEMVLNSKIFIYIGGESDSEWVENNIMNEIDKKKTIVINMMDIINEYNKLIEEEEPESADSKEEGEKEEEYDEHIWTSISNEKLLVEEITNKIISIDEDNKSYYENNRDSFINQLDEIDLKIKELIPYKKLLIFADRFPLVYFVKEYGFEYDAAFKGCDASKDASFTTIEKLTNKVINNHISVIFNIELSESNVSKTIINNCKEKGINVELKTFYTMHNVSKDDFKKGLTYIDFMNKNIENLKAAFNYVD